MSFIFCSVLEKRAEKLIASLKSVIYYLTIAKMNPNYSNLTYLEILSKIMKKKMLLTIKAAQTGHLGACCSSNELMSVLYFSGLLRYDINDPHHPDRDYVLARGHVGPLRYNIFAYLGWLDESEMTDYRKFGSRLHGHEDMNVTPGVDLTPSGSLGMLLSYSVGAALSFRERKRPNRIWCFLGDGEEQEGNVSEAARHAANLNLNQLIVIIDKNGKQLSTSTITTDHGTGLAKIWEGYGWKVLNITDGHNISEIHKTFETAVQLSEKNLVCIIANTIKGHGIENALNHYCGYHVYHNNVSSGKSNHVNVSDPIDLIDQELSQYTLTDLPIFEKQTFRQSLPRGEIPPQTPPYVPIILTELEKGTMGTSTTLVSDNNVPRQSSYDYLMDFLYQYIKINKHKKTYILTADYPPRNTIYDTGRFFLENDVTYINVGIREQHLFSMIHGLKTVEPDALILVLCGDAFMYRCADQINVLAQSNDHVIIYSVQAGLSGAQNGFTHQSSGIPGCFVTMPGVTVYEPTTKSDWFFAMNNAFAANKGVQYMRTHAGLNSFKLGQQDGSDLYSVKIGENPLLTIVSCGMITEDAYEAALQLYKDFSISSVVVNVVNLSNLSGIGSLIPTGTQLFIFYNGNPLVFSSAISRQLLLENCHPAILHEHGFTIGTTGKIEDLKKHFKLDKEGIYEQIITEALMIPSISIDKTQLPSVRIYAQENTPTIKGWRDFQKQLISY